MWIDIAAAVLVLTTAGLLAFIAGRLNRLADKPYSARPRSGSRDS